MSRRVHRTLRIEELEPRIAPVTIDLQAGSDSGASNTDNITNINLPTYDVTVTQGGTIDIDWNGNAIVDPEDIVGSVVGGAGTYAYAPLVPLLDGLYPCNVTFTPAGPIEIDSDPTTIDTAVVAPVAPDLDAASDSGILDTDNITNDNLPVFSGGPGSSEGSATVEIYADDGGGAVSQGTTTALVDGSWSFTIPAALADATYNITARQTDLAGNVSVLSAALVVTIDTVASAVPAGAPDLQPGSDTGLLNNDDYTSDITPTFDIIGVGVGDYWRMYRDGTLMSEAPTTGDDGGIYKGPAVAGPPSGTETLSTQPLGTYNFTVRSVDTAGNESGDSAALPVEFYAGGEIDVRDGVGDPLDLVMAYGDFINDGAGGVRTTRTISIWNVGDGPLTITGITVGGADPGQFPLDPASIPALPFLIGPHNSLNVVVVYDPTTNVAHNATISIDSDDLDEPTVNVDVNGTGNALGAGAPLNGTTNTSYQFVDANGDTILLNFKGAGTATVYGTNGAAPAGTDIAYVDFSGTDMTTSYRATVRTPASATPDLIGGGMIGDAGEDLGRIVLTSRGGTVAQTDIVIDGNVNQVQVTGILDNSWLVGGGIQVAGTSNKILLRDGMNDAVLNLDGDARMIQIFGNVVTVHHITPILLDNANDVGRLYVKGLVSSLGHAYPDTLIDIDGDASIVQLMGGIHSEPDAAVMDIDIEAIGSTIRKFDIKRYCLATDIELGSFAPGFPAVDRITIYREYADFEVGGVSSTLVVNGDTGRLTFKTDVANIGLFLSDITLNGDVDVIRLTGVWQDSNITVTGDLGYAQLFGAAQDTTFTVGGNLGYVKRGAIDGVIERNTCQFFTIAVGGNLERGGSLPFYFGTGSSFTLGGSVLRGSLRIYQIDNATIDITGDIPTLKIESSANTTDIDIGGNVTRQILAVKGLTEVETRVAGTLPKFQVMGSMTSCVLDAGLGVPRIVISGSLESSLLNLGGDVDRIQIYGDMSASEISIDGNANRINVGGSVLGGYTGDGAYDVRVYDTAVDVDTNWTSTLNPISEVRPSIYRDTFDDEYVVWQQRDFTGDDWEIYYEINDGGAIQLTDNDRNDVLPSIFVDNTGVIHIVWQWQQDTDPADWEICYWNSTMAFTLPLDDADNATLVAVADELGTGNDVDDLYPMIDQSSTATNIRFAWQQQDPDDNTIFYICYSTIDSTSVVSPLPINQRLTPTDNIIGETPAIENDKIAYVRAGDLPVPDPLDPDTTDYEIWFWDHAGMNYQITFNDTDDLNPSTYGDDLNNIRYIAFERYGDTGHDPAPMYSMSAGQEITGEPEIWLWSVDFDTSVTTEEAIATDPDSGEYSIEPSIWVDNIFTGDVGVAYQHREPVGDIYNYDIYYWTDAEPDRRITNSPADDITPWVHGVWSTDIAYAWYDGLPEPTLDVAGSLTYMSAGGDMGGVSCFVGTGVGGGDLGRLKIVGDFYDDDTNFDWTVFGDVNRIAIGVAAGTPGDWSDTAGLFIEGDLTDRLVVGGDFLIGDPTDSPDPGDPVEEYPYIYIGGTAAGTRINIGGYMNGIMDVGDPAVAGTGRFGDMRVGLDFNGRIDAEGMGIDNTFKALDSPSGLIFPANAFENYAGYP
ncbi:MAG: hypothetical protein GXP25_20355 [Planctomycetes bacterium]|nr:hypothetical protein [Planctomycetota bacterium]